MVEAKISIKYVKWIPLIVVLGFTIFISFLIWENIFYTIIVTVAVAFLYGSGEAFMDYVRMRTSILLTDDGCRRSFRSIDKVIVSSPFKNDYNYVIYATGGSDWAYLPFRGGMLENPFIIVPREFVISTDGGSAGEIASGNIHDMEFDHLPPFLRQALERHPSGHFNRNYSKIKMIDVSYINLSSTDINVDYATRLQHWINAYNKQHELVETLTDEIRKIKALERHIDDTEKARYIIMPSEKKE